MKILIALSLLFICASVAHAQDAQATIYVYRNFYHTTFGKAAPTIIVNDEKVAVLDEGRYIAVRVPAGFTVVKCGKKRENRVDIDARSGETYYLRIRAHPGKLFARFELFRITKEEAAKDSEKLRPAESGDVKSERVIRDAPKP